MVCCIRFRVTQFINEQYSSRSISLGSGYIKNDQLVNEPFDFSKKNRVYLGDLHQVLRSVIFPESVPVKQRFDLSPEDYRFSYRYMSAYPFESSYPNYDTGEYESRDEAGYIIGRSVALDATRNINVSENYHPNSNILKSRNFYFNKIQDSICETYYTSGKL